MPPLTRRQGPSISTLRRGQIAQAYRSGVRKQQPRAQHDLAVLLAERPLAGRTSSRSLPAMQVGAPPSNDFPPPRLSETLPRPLCGLAGGTERLIDLGIRRFSRLSTPTWRPSLDRPLSLPWCFVRCAAWSCTVSVGCGMALAIGGGFALPWAAMGMIYGAGHGAQMLMVDPWIYSCYAGIDDAISEQFSGLARLAENDQAAKQCQALQATLRAQYRLMIQNLSRAAMGGGQLLGTVIFSVAITGALLPSMPAWSTLGITMAVYLGCTVARVHLMPLIQRWRSFQDNQCSIQGSETLAVNSVGMLSDYQTMRGRHIDQLTELSRRTTYTKLIRFGFEAIEAGLLIALFGLKNNHVSMIGTSVMSVIIACRNINVQMNQIRRTRETFEKMFVEPSLVHYIKQQNLEIACNGSSEGTSLEQLLGAVEANEPGFWVICGKNQSGKSLLLRHIKEAMGEGASYFPASGTIGRDAKPLSHQSTGEGKMERLLPVLEAYEDGPGEPSGALLLDEPTGALAPGLSRSLFARFSKIAERACVVIVTHAPHEQIYGSGSTRAEPARPVAAC
jgi:hypothetical protein